MTTDTNGKMSDHALETFKSLIQIALRGLGLLALLNGGAAVALLSYLGNIAGKGSSVPDMRLPMGAYLSGLVLCGLAFVFGYLTQLFLYNESTGQAKRAVHRYLLWLSIAFAFLSLAAFAIGSSVAVVRFPGGGVTC